MALDVLLADIRHIFHATAVVGLCSCRGSPVPRATSAVDAALYVPHDAPRAAEVTEDGLRVEALAPLQTTQPQPTRASRRPARFAGSQGRPPNRSEEEEEE